MSENVNTPEDRLASVRLDPQFPDQVYDPKYGRWCHSAADLYRWLTRPNENPADVGNIFGYPDNVECQTCAIGPKENTIPCRDCGGTRRTPENVECPTCDDEHLVFLSSLLDPEIRSIHPCPDCTPENVETSNE